MHVIVVPSWYPTKLGPGKGIFFREQAQALSKECNIRILHPVGQGIRHFLFQAPVPLGRQLLNNPPVTIVRYPIYRWRCSSKVQMLSIGKYGAQAIEEIEKGQGKVDVLLAQGWAGACWAMEWGRRRHLPVVIVEHVNPMIDPTLQNDAFLQQAYRNAVIKSTVFCVVSDALRRWVLTYIMDTQLNPIVVGNLINTDVFTPKMSKTTSKEFRIVTVASSAQIKDMETFIKAIAYVRQTDAKLSIKSQIIGSQSPASERYRLLCSRLGIPDVIKVSDGQRPRAEVLSSMQNADLFVSSSINETFGIVMAEALACETPVVATRSGGAEFILGESSHFLVEVRDPIALGSKIIDVLRGRVSFDAARSRQDIVRRFGRPAFEQRMIRILQTAIAEYGNVQN